MLPSLGAEYPGVCKRLGNGGVQICACVHPERVDRHAVSLEENNVSLAGPAWDGRRLQRLAHVEGGGWMQSKGLVEDVFNICQIFECFVRRRCVAPQFVEDLLAQPGPHLGVVGQLVHCPRESRRSGISASKKHGHDLISNLFGIPGVAGDAMQK